MIDDPTLEKLLEEVRLSREEYMNAEDKKKHSYTAMYEADRLLQLAKAQYNRTQDKVLFYIETGDLPDDDTLNTLAFRP